MDMLTSRAAGFARADFKFSEARPPTRRRCTVSYDNEGTHPSNLSRKALCLTRRLASRPDVTRRIKSRRIISRAIFCSPSHTRKCRPGLQRLLAVATLDLQGLNTSARRNEITFYSCLESDRPICRVRSRGSPGSEVTGRRRAL